MYNSISPRGLQYLNDFTTDTVSVPTIIKLQALDMWRLEMEWTMNQKEEGRNQMFEIQVGRTTNMDIVGSVSETHHSFSSLANFCFALMVYSLFTDKC